MNECYKESVFNWAKQFLIFTPNSKVYVGTKKTNKKEFLFSSYYFYSESEKEKIAPLQSFSKILFSLLASKTDFPVKKQRDAKGVYFKNIAIVESTTEQKSIFPTSSFTKKSEPDETIYSPKYFPNIPDKTFCFKNRKFTKIFVEDTFVYLIKNETTNRLKIGYSGNPIARLKQFHNNSDCLFSLIAFIEGDRKKEEKVQSRFKQYSISVDDDGEWFIEHQDIYDYFFCTNND